MLACVQASSLVLILICGFMVESVALLTPIWGLQFLGFFFSKTASDWPQLILAIRINFFCESKNIGCGSS